MDPRHIDEYLLGVSYEFTDRLTGRAHCPLPRRPGTSGKTPTTMRVSFMNHLLDIPQELYIENLDEIRAEIGGSSYVIAQLDDAYTDYWELNLEAEWRGDNYYVQGFLCLQRLQRQL